MNLEERRLPPHARRYRQSPAFTTSNTPEALQRNHATRAGTWGLLVVSDGSVTFRDVESGLVRTLFAGDRQVILPESLHAALPGSDTVFHVEFYRMEEEERPKSFARGRR